MTRLKYTKELLEEAVSNSTSMAGVLRHLGRRPGGGTQEHISKTIKKFEIDCSHFTGSAHTRGKAALNRKKPEEHLTLGNELDRRVKRETLLWCMAEMGVEYKCSGCGIGPEWNEQSLTLEIDHINGKAWDNRIENLRFLCPNCHSQQKDTNRSWRFR